MPLRAVIESIHRESGLLGVTVFLAVIALSTAAAMVHFWIAGACIWMEATGRR